MVAMIAKKNTAARFCCRLVEKLVGTSDQIEQWLSGCIRLGLVQPKLFAKPPGKFCNGAFVRHLPSGCGPPFEHQSCAQPMKNNCSSVYSLKYEVFRTVTL